MIQIARCRGSGCPYRTHCARAQIPEAERGDVVLMIVPFDEQHSCCDAYLPMPPELGPDGAYNWEHLATLVAYEVEMLSKGFESEPNRI